MKEKANATYRLTLPESEMKNLRKEQLYKRDNYSQNTKVELNRPLCL
jgi:hypothetical protein